MELSPTKPSSHNKKCIKNSNAVFVCTDKKCTDLNPFICSDDECECSKIHDECKQIKVKVFINKVEALFFKDEDQLKDL